MLVRRLPHVDVRGEVEEEGGIRLRAGHGTGPVEARPQVGGARVAGGDLAHEPVRGGVEVRGHLHRERPARREALDPHRDEAQVARHPLEGRIGDEDVDRGPELGGVPVLGGRLNPFDAAVGVELARAAEHVGRAVDADDPRVGPALGEPERQLARPAAEVDDEPGRRGVHTGQQVGEGSAAVAGEDGILPRVPGGIGRAVAGAAGGGGAAGRVVSGGRVRRRGHVILGFV